MKYADCNARQKKAYRNIYHASNWLLGGLENTMQDNAEGTEEHKKRKGDPGGPRRPGRGALQNGDDGHLRRRKLLLQPGGGKLPEGHPLLQERMVDGQMRS